MDAGMGFNPIQRDWTPCAGHSKSRRMAEPCQWAGPGPVAKEAVPEESCHQEKLSPVKETLLQQQG